MSNLVGASTIGFHDWPHAVIRFIVASGDLSNRPHTVVMVIKIS